jgi:A/G-specific adenine glycosylase
MDAAATVSSVLHWYAGHARELPWRRPGVTPWQVMVSEFMLQQTPVERVRVPWQEWLCRWPTPSALAAVPSGDAVRAWGRLGYPRRALRLHQSAVLITTLHDGQVPDDRERLLALPGVGSYTAAAILSFAYRQRHLVLDTNVRRVLARLDGAVAFPGATVGAAETARAERYLPATAPLAAQWAVASMEFGALVCTAKSPRCDGCPVRDACAWRSQGYPDWEGPPRKGQTYQGTDRQCRGSLLSVLRSAAAPVARTELERAWHDAGQTERALQSLIADGLAVAVGESAVALPG